MYTVLICDDDKDIVSALDIYLTSEGYRTLKAYDGLECLKLVEEHEVHLILLDVMMPGLDGIRPGQKPAAPVHHPGRPAACRGTGGAHQRRHPSGRRRQGGDGGR